MAANAAENMNRSSTTPEFKSKGQSADTDFKKMSEDVGGRIRTMASDLTESASGYLESSRHFVKQNPGRSVGFALAAGVVVGTLITLLMAPRK